MIAGWADKGSRDLFDGSNTKEARKIPRDIWPVVKRKLDLLDASVSFNDLRVPPSNHLEKLKGDLAGFYSIRVNDQYRIVFKWEDGNCTEVKVTDYH